MVRRYDFRTRRILLMTFCGTAVVAWGLLWAASAQEQSPAPSGETRAGQMKLTFEKERLSVSLDQCPLGGVLEEVQARTRVVLIAANEVSAELISAEFRDQPLEQGLRRLLGSYDLFFFYGATKDAPSSLRTVWIYPRGSASTLRPVPPELWANAKDIEAVLSETDPQLREKAYDALMARPDRRSRDLVLRALVGDTERDDALRQRLFSAANSRGFVVPPDVLAQLARWDRSPVIRWMALDTLATSDAAKPTAQAALTDPDESVRERAKQILEQFESAGRVPK